MSGKRHCKTCTCENVRVELGCQSQACFCTGRCKRTQEEQDAYEKRDKEMLDVFRNATEKFGWK